MSAPLNPTAEELALAMKCADAVAIKRESLLWKAAMQGALAAIRETTERAIKHAYAYVDMSAGSDDPCVQAAEATAIAIATDFEAGYHLKDTSHADA